MSDVPGEQRTGWDFFLSYTQADREWAEWVAWQLEDAGYQVERSGCGTSPGTAQRDKTI